ncbi:glycosyltransferase family 2 protein [Agromyces sp. Marseille-P2726]|uniref:glycosyltransferase family 2 protein n=1 Tax=Agromyces sp. Marseille-P2726 TaxID=2709132 RepID=UPI00156D6C90|nr:glycosyltransferase family 2 protein [Agromyces sp. Marseille-P2726]
MLALVTSLRHPHNSNDYPRVERLLYESVVSWLRQTEDRFMIIVVGNQEPRLPPDSRVRYVPVAFPPPSPIASPRTGIPSILRDRGTKLAVGLAAARQHGAQHILFIDADDFVSRRVAAHVAAHPEAIGWRVNFPWRVNVERRAIHSHEGGTFSIVRTDLYPDPQLPLDATQSELYDGYGEKLERWLGSHLHIGSDLGLPPLPFDGALYRVGTGESHSGISMGGLGRPISRALAQEFGVPATPRTPAGLLRAVLPSQRAWKDRLAPFRGARGSER